MSSNVNVRRLIDLVKDQIGKECNKIMEVPVTMDDARKHIEDLSHRVLNKHKEQKHIQSNYRVNVRETTWEDLYPNKWKVRLAKLTYALYKMKLVKLNYDYLTWFHFTLPYKITIRSYLHNDVLKFWYSASLEIPHGSLWTEMFLRPIIPIEYINVSITLPKGTGSAKIEQILKESGVYFDSTRSSSGSL